MGYAPKVESTDLIITQGYKKSNVKVVLKSMYTVQGRIFDNDGFYLLSLSAIETVCFACDSTVC